MDNSIGEALRDEVLEVEAEAGRAQESRSDAGVSEALAPAHVALAAAAVALSGCGGGGGGGSSAGSGAIPVGGVDTTPPPYVPPSDEEAARFLTHATFGPTMAEIQAVKNLGYSAWLNQQFQTPSMDTHFGYVTRGGPVGCTTCDRQYINAFMESFWHQAVEGPDSLRQRIAFALTELFVISEVNSPLEANPQALAGYLDMLAERCFGNFRDLIEGVARHPSMGHYLSHLRNEREDPVTGRIPDENFAREIMQLFTIGLWELNEDGSRRKDMFGRDIPTYGQAEISGMAKVFTGWSWGGDDEDYHRWQGWPIGEENTMRWDRLMRHYSAFASTSEKRIVRGVVIPANTGPVESLRIALDTLFNHPNVGPFIGSQLIKRLVTSNPSPAYVRRVTQAFNDNGSGVRGDMRAVIRAVLLDSEATDFSALSSQTAGKIREPIIRLGAFLRAFSARADNGLYAIWNLEDAVYSIGQNPLRAPSVFNWFRPDYAPPGALAEAGLTAPEFQISHETTVTGWANFAFNLAFWGIGWEDSRVYSQYAAELPLVVNTDALLDRVNLLLTARQMDSATLFLVKSAVDSFPSTGPDAAFNRVGLCVAMTLICPQFLMQR